MHKTVLVQGPQVEPLTRTEVRKHLNLSDTTDTMSTYLDSLIVTVREQMERYLNRTLITQQWKVFYDNWCEEMLIPFPVLQSVQSVKYYDLEGTLITVTQSDYLWVVTTEDPGRLIRKYDAVYPEVEYGRPDAIEISFTCGYGDAATAIPAPIKHAMKLWITNLYEHRGDVVVGNTVGEIPKFVTDLIHTYKIYEF